MGDVSTLRERFKAAQTGIIPRLPLTVVCTLNGAETDGVLVGVQVDDLDRIEADLRDTRRELEKLRRVAMWADVQWGLGDEESSNEYFWAGGFVLEALEAAGYSGDTTYAAAATKEGEGADHER
jgi:hypothetical protein